MGDHERPALHRHGVCNQLRLQLPQKVVQPGLMCVVWLCLRLLAGSCLCVVVEGRLSAAREAADRFLLTKVVSVRPDVMLKVIWRCTLDFPKVIDCSDLRFFPF